MEYVVVGAGAIGGTVGARLARDGHRRAVLRRRRRARRRDQRARADDRGAGRAVHRRARRPSSPDDLPDGLGAVLLAVKSQHTGGALRGDRAAARAGRLRRLAPERHQRAADRRGRRARSGRSARSSTSAPTTSSRAGSSSAAAARSTSASSTAAPSERVDAARARPRRTRRRPATSSAILWAKEAYGAMLFATAVSDLSIADALAEPRYRALFVRLASEVLAAAPVAGRAVRRLRRRRPRRLDRAPRRVQPALGQDALGHLPRPRGAQADRPRRRSSPTSTGRSLRRTLELIREIEDGPPHLRGREPRAARRVRAAARSGRRG